MKRLFKTTVSALALGLSLTSVGVWAQGSSEPYTPGVTKDAVSYWLPRTSLILTVNTRHTVFTPGEFSRYAERYLRLTDVKDKAEQTWTITGITLSTRGIPDEGQLYTLLFPSNGPKPYVELTEDCILAGINVLDAEKARSTDVSKETPAPPTSTAKDVRSYMTEEIIMSGSVAKMAELTAKEIYNIRESRNNILRGQADNIPTDGESAKYFIEQLDIQEEALLTLFNGTTQEQDESFTVEISPDEPLSKLVAFRFSSKLGVLPVDNLAGEPVWIDIENKDIFPQSDKSGKRGNSENSTPVVKKGSGQFLYCRVPGRAVVKVYNNRESFITQEIPLAQFGSVEVVSKSIMGRQADTKITFNTATGAVSSINGK